MKYTLYGDGIHDDTAAIQELIDEADCELRLPAPKNYYLISKSLELPSNFKLSLPRFAKIKLAKDSNCTMVRNKMVHKVPEPDDAKYLALYYQIFTPDNPCENIEIEGGIWDFNNKEQMLNPMWFQKEDGSLVRMSSLPENERIVAKDSTGVRFCGYGFLFYNVKNLRISSLTLKDPVTFAVVLDTVSYFTVNDITFDYNHGKVLAYNMDGIHLNGNCHYGTITNLKGACHDDLVAINADEGTSGPITHITVNGIYAEVCHSAIRVLSCNQPVKNIHISDVYGSYYQYCIGLTKFHYSQSRGLIDGITIENVHVTKAARLPVFNQGWGLVFPIVYVDSQLVIKGLRVSNVHYREEANPYASVVQINKDTVVKQLMLDNIIAENNTCSGEEKLFENFGTVENLIATGIYENGKKVEIKI